MAFKVVVLCAFAFMVQSIAGQICNRPSYSSSSSSLSSSGCQSISVSNNGGDLIVTTVGPIAPAGIALATDLGLAGDVIISGTLPYLSAVAFEGQFPTSGSAPVSYGCGDSVTITSQIGGSGSLPSIGGSGSLSSISGSGSLSSIGSSGSLSSIGGCGSLLSSGGSGNLLSSGGSGNLLSSGGSGSLSPIGGCGSLSSIGGNGRLFSIGGCGCGR